jgi:hypothetical protein
MNRRRFLQLLGLTSMAAALPLPAIAEAVPLATVEPSMLLEGIPYWQAHANSGTYAGIERAAYPGRLATPTIHARISHIDRRTQTIYFEAMR